MTEPTDNQVETPNLRPKMVLGSFWMIGINLFKRGLGIISTIILARLLPPADFGLVAMATVLLALLQAVTEFGFDVTLIQKQHARRSHYDTAWTFKVIFGVGSAIVLASLAYPASAYYSEPRVAPIVLFLSIGVLLRGFENIGIVNFRKEFQYDKEFRFFTSIKFAAFVVTVSTALLLRSYWALVIGTLTSRFVGLLLSYTMHDYRPRFTISERKELFSFSVWLFLNNLLMFVRTRGADFIVGRLLGARSLGLITIGSEIARLPTRELIAPINRAIFPGYSKISHDPGRMKRAFLNVFSVIAFVAIPAATGIAVISVTAIPALLGSQWTDTIPLVHTLAFVGLLSSLHSNTGAAYIALGRPKIHVILQTISVIILLPATFIFAEDFGIIGVAYAYLLANGTTFVINIFIAIRLIQISPLQALDSVVRPAVAAAAMYVAVAEIQNYLSEHLVDLVNMLLSMLAGASVYTVVVFGLWIAFGRPAGAESIVLGYLRKAPGIGRMASRLLVTRES